jgi:hypothetical protein
MPFVQNSGIKALKNIYREAIEVFLPGGSTGKKVRVRLRGSAVKRNLTTQ